MTSLTRKLLVALLLIAGLAGAELRAQDPIPADEPMPPGAQPVEPDEPAQPNQPPRVGDVVRETTITTGDEARDRDAARRARERAEQAAEDERRAGDKFQLASVLYKRQQYKPAIRIYDEMVRTYPRDERVPEALYYMGQACLQEGDTKKARESFALLRTRYPGHELTRRANLREAELLYHDGDLKNASTLLEGLPLDGTDEVYEERVLFYRGMTLYKLKQTVEAAANLELLAAKPMDAKHELRTLGRLYLAYLRWNDQEVEQAKALFDELIASDVTSAQAREDAMFQLATLYYKLDDMDRAVAGYKAFIERFPRSDRAGEARLRMAWAYNAQGRFEQVLDVLATNQGGAPPEPDQAMYLLSVAYLKLNRPEPAIPILRRFTKDYPGSTMRPAAELALVEALMAQRAFQQAAEEAERLLRANQRHKYTIELMSYLGRCYFELEDWENVARVYSIGLNTYPSRWPDRERSLRALARAYQKTGQTDKALSTFRSLLVGAKDEDKPGILFRLADIEAEAGNIESAVAYYEQVVKEFPNHELLPLARFNVAEMRIRQKKNSEAQAQLNLFITTYPKHELVPKAYYMRGTVHLRSDRPEQAVEDLNKALEAKFDQANYARLSLALAYWELKEEQKALAEFSIVMKDAEVFAQVPPSFMATIGNRLFERNQVADAEHVFKLLAGKQEPEAQYDGLVGLGNIDLYRDEFAKAQARFETASKLLPNDRPRIARVQALLGESFRRQGQDARALIAFAEALSKGAPDARTGALAHWGSAVILDKRGDLKKAEEEATAAYILFDDPVYSPKAMLLEIKLATKLNNPKDAKRVLQDLSKNHPVAYTTFRNDPENAALFKQVGGE